jgi:hypothetical protein
MPRKSPLHDAYCIDYISDSLWLIELVIGIDIGRVRCIFKVPKEFIPLAGAEPLAYVEWFTPLGTFDDTIGMYTVSPSMSRGHRSVTIICITDIVRSCHLIPQWGPFMDVTWTQDNVLDKCQCFYVNPYLRHSDFVLFRYLPHKNT